MAENPQEMEFFASVELLVAEGPEKGKKYQLSAGRNVIGRAPDNAVCLSDNVVSRNHACITVDRDLQLEDMGSAQGTILNGRMLMGVDFLFDNDEIRVGPYTMRLTVKRKESGKGMKLAFSALGAALAVLAAALLLPAPSGGGGESGSAETGKTAAPERDWRNWENFDLPDRKALVEAELLPEEGAVLDAETAMGQFNLGTRLYQDRLGDPGNAYRSLAAYKRGLAVTNMLEPAARPPIASRCLERIGELQGIIRADCDNRVFAFQRAYKLKRLGECYRILREIRNVDQWSGGRYSRFAASWLATLERMK